MGEGYHLEKIKGEGYHIYKIKGESPKNEITLFKLFVDIKGFFLLLHYSVTTDISFSYFLVKNMIQL